MKVVIQRVSEASVTIANQVVAQIQQGLVVLVGIEDKDTIEDINVNIFDNLRENKNTIVVENI